jgi:hypothetical protein
MTCGDALENATDRLEYLSGTTAVDIGPEPDRCTCLETKLEAVCAELGYVEACPSSEEAGWRYHCTVENEPYRVAVPSIASLEDVLLWYADEDAAPLVAISMRAFDSPGWCCAGTSATQRWIGTPLHDVDCPILDNTFPTGDD